MTVDLSTTYLGLRLRSPIVASASPLTGELDTARRLEDAGAAAIVLPSLFEEEVLDGEIELNRSIETGTEQSPRRSTTSRHWPCSRALRSGMSDVLSRSDSGPRSP